MDRSNGRFSSCLLIVRLLSRSLRFVQSGLTMIPFKDNPSAATEEAPFSWEMTVCSYE